MTDRNRVVTAGSRVRLRLASDEHLVGLVRRGDSTAFEAVYERHARGLLSFCIYMLGSRQDAEDATQATFASAYRALCTDQRPITLRPWLFTIARNECLSILRKRQTTVELNGEPALRGDPGRELELREEVRHMVKGLLELPERQRAALVLAELHGLSQVEIGAVLGVRKDQVKAYIYQARSNLISERQARETDCRDIREALATARGAALLRARLRRHVRSCAGCRTYADGVTRQHHQLGALLPLAPTLLARYRSLWDMLEIGQGDPATYEGGVVVGGTAAAAAAGIAGGGIKALAGKVAVGAVVLGAGAGVGVSALTGGGTQGQEAPVPVATAPMPLIASVTRTAGASRDSVSPRLAQRPQRNRGEARGERNEAPAAPSQQSPSLISGAAEVYPPVRDPGSSGEGGQIPAQEPYGRREAQRVQRTVGPGASHGDRQQKHKEGEQKHKERELRREERQGTREARKREEEHAPVGGAGPPKKSKEERRRAREERKRELREP